MNRKERYKFIINYFLGLQPTPETELSYSNPFQLLVAVALSAQCTDKRVNMVTPKLFLDFPDSKALATADFEMLFPYIRSISYPNNKAKNLIAMAKMLETDFNSVVPESIDDLQKLPGVGRKTANVIASVIYEKPAMAVDTHVFRVSRRLGLVSQTAKTPILVEKQLVANIASDLIRHAHHWLILHGRYVCIARKPNCANCGISSHCKFFEDGIKKQNKLASLAQ